MLMFSKPPKLLLQVVAYPCWERSCFSLARGSLQVYFVPCHHQQELLQRRSPGMAGTHQEHPHPPLGCCSSHGLRQMANLVCENKPRSQRAVSKGQFPMGNGLHFPPKSMENWLFAPLDSSRLSGSSHIAQIIIVSCLRNRSCDLIFTLLKSASSNIYFHGLVFLTIFILIFCQ